MCKNWLYCKLNLSLILDISCAYALYSSPWRRLDLLSTFVLTPIYVVASEEDPDFVVEDVE